MGYEPQDFKHKSGPVGIEIGPRCTFRENVNIHPGTDIGKPITRIGHDCYFMVGTHLAHEGQMGNHVVVSNGAQIGGNVTIGDHAILGGLCAIHQHTRIGSHAFIGGMATVLKDIIPYGFVLGNPAHSCAQPIDYYLRKKEPLPSVWMMPKRYMGIMISSKI